MQPLLRCNLRLPVHPSLRPLQAPSARQVLGQHLVQMQGLRLYPKPSLLVLQGKAAQTMEPSVQQ